MKKNLFILAVAAFALASCSNDDTVAENVSFNESNAISFRPAVNGVTRAVDQDASTLQATNAGFFATAIHTANATTTTYFDNIQFTYSNGTYNSATPYYWPAAGTIDFFAYAPAISTQLSRTDHQTFTVTPDDAAANQIDFIYANTDNKSKTAPYTPTGGSESTYGAAGVPLNFRHAESKIVVKVKNTSANMKFEVSGFKVGYLDKTATFIYEDTNTDGKNATQLAYTDWKNNTDYAIANEYVVETTSANAVAASQSEAKFLGASALQNTSNTDYELILIPQKPTAATAYASGSQGANLNGAYIAVKMVIKNNNNDGVVIADASQNARWAIWPVAHSWEPGKKYTYTIDLAGGGFWETNDDTDPDLDPILENAIIKFVDVTVDTWEASAQDVAIPVQ